MKEKLKEIFDRLQELDLPPTLTNLELMLQTLYDLRDIYKKLTEGDDSDDSAAE